MLNHKLDLDRAFDLTIKNSLPYLIFPSDTFKLKLSGMLSSLNQYYVERNEIKFEQLNNEIEEMMSDVKLDTNTDITMFNFKHHQMTLDQAQQRLNERLVKCDAFLSEFEDMKIQIANLEKSLEGTCKGHVQESTSTKAINKSSSIDSANNSKKPTNVDLVLDCIKKLDVPHSYAEIAEVIGIKKKQVDVAMNNIKKNRPDECRNIIFSTKKHTRSDSSTIDVIAVIWNPDAKNNVAATFDKT